MSKTRITSVAAASGLAAIALFAVQPATADEGNEEAAVEMTEGEERLARMLEGRVAGEPQSCIQSRFNDRMRTIDGTAYVYGRGRTIYVQRTRNPDRIDDRDTLVSQRFNGTQLCKQDVTTTIDAFQGFVTGAVFFEDFIPYTRVDNEAG